MRAAYSLNLGFRLIESKKGCCIIRRLSEGGEHDGGKWENNPWEYGMIRRGTRAVFFCKYLTK